MKFFKDKKLEVDVYTSQINLIENHIVSILGRLNKLEELNIKPEPQTDLSDEEIMQVYKDALGIKLSSDMILDFARAILKKASKND